MSHASPLFSLLVILFLICTCPKGEAENFSGYRSWQLKGRAIDSVVLLSWSADHTKVVLASLNGKTAEVMVADLSQDDQAFIGRAIAASKASAAKTGLQEGDSVFRQFTAVDRTTLPLLDQGKYGQKASDCVPSSFCNFVLWWDQQNVLPIGKRGDFENKAEWVHTQMARLCGTRNTSGTGEEEALEGFGKYFAKELADQMTFSMKIDQDIRPENIARYTVGYNATMLSVTIERGPSTSGHWVSLLSATPDGELVFHTWGHRMKGRMVVHEKKDKLVGYNRGTRRPVNGTIYEIKVAPDPAFSDFIKQTRFFLDPEEWDALVIVKPYVFAKQGEKSGAPDDPLMSLQRPDDPY